MHLKYIIVCAILLSVATVIYTNIDTEVRVDSQFTRTGIIDRKEKNEPIIREAYVAQPIPPEEPPQSEVKKLTKANDNLGYEV